MNRALTVAALVILGCGEPGGAVRTEVVFFDAERRQYTLREVELENLESLYELRGRWMRLTGGASIEVTINAELWDPGCRLNGDVSCTAGEEERRQAVVAGGHKVSPRFFRSGDLYRPLDFKTLELTTAYYNLDRAAAFFAAHGWPTAPGSRSTAARSSARSS